MRKDTERCSVRFAEIGIANKASFLQKIQEIADPLGVHLICFDACNCTGSMHVCTAVMRAARSFASGSPIARTFEMEALLYAAGSRQCSIASGFGVHEGKNSLYVCCYPEKPEAWDLVAGIMRLLPVPDVPPDQAKSRHLMDLFGITEGELSVAGRENLEELILERVAMLDVNR
jgi:KEOPS complex subunit Cgi121